MTVEQMRAKHLGNRYEAGVIITEGDKKLRLTKNGNPDKRYTRGKDLAIPLYAQRQAQLKRLNANLRVKRKAAKPKNDYRALKLTAMIWLLVLISAGIYFLSK